MSHSPSDVYPLPPDSGRLLPANVSAQTACTSETQDEDVDAALRSPEEQLEHVARHSEGQDVPHAAVHVDRLQESPLQHACPVTRLPPELLAYIFELYTARLSGSMPHRDGGVSLQGPFCLAQVCTLWRTVAESDPRLWTSIHFYFSESHHSREEDVQRVRPALDLHLKRSGALPISLSFTDDRAYHSDTEDLISLLVDRLRTHARRWKRISLRLAGAYFTRLFTFTPCDLTCLEHFSINGNTVVFTYPNVLHLNLWSATNLKSFHYSGPGPSEDRIDLDWESLAEVSFEFSPHYGGSFTSHRRFAELARCQNITTCSLGIDRPPPVEINYTITLPCLQTLRVRRLSPYAHASGAIAPLILPQLQTLEIDASSLVIQNQRWHDRTFSDLLARSGRTLLRLSIQDVDFPNDELIRCLALSRSLTSLRFIPCPRSQDISDVIRRLDASPAEMPSGTRTPNRRERRQVRIVAPQLREITLGSSVREYLQPMMAMFRSRVGPDARAGGLATLRRAEVVFFDLWHGTVVNVNRVRVLGDRLESVVRFREDLARLALENRNGDGDGDDDGKKSESGDVDELETSVVVSSPYLPEYIDVP